MIQFNRLNSFLRSHAALVTQLVIWYNLARKEFKALKVPKGYFLGERLETEVAQRYKNINQGSLNRVQKKRAGSLMPF